MVSSTTVCNAVRGKQCRLTPGGHRCTTATASAVCHLLGAFASFASTADSTCATLPAKLLLSHAEGPPARHRATAHARSEHSQLDDAYLRVVSFGRLSPADMHHSQRETCIQRDRWLQRRIVTALRFPCLGRPSLQGPIGRSRGIWIFIRRIYQPHQTDLWCLAALRLLRALEPVHHRWPVLQMLMRTAEWRWMA